MAERFWAKVDRSGDCWVWTACISGGYGHFNVDGRILKAHRVAYEMLVGPIPEGLQLDHLCRNRACVNPGHLEPVTPRENVLRSPIAEASVHARKTRCKNGHEFSPENTGVYSDRRRCRSCHQLASRRYRKKAKG